MVMLDGRETTALYIAGPMTGKPAFNYPAFDLAYTLLKEAGFEVILNPVDACKDCNHQPSSDAPHPWEWYMRSALRMVLDVDGIALLPGWDESRGAKLEVSTGEALGLQIQPLYYWITEGHNEPAKSVGDAA